MQDDDDIENYKFPAGDDSNDENPDEADVARAEKDDFIRCPHCKKSNHPEALTCRFCKYYLTDDHHPTGKPLWIRVTVVIIVALCILCFIFGYSGSDMHFNFSDWGKR